MKLRISLITLVLMMPLSASAAENNNDEVDYVAFCNEQAELAGIDDAEEKKSYVDICLTNYGITLAE